MSGKHLDFLSLLYLLNVWQLNVCQTIENTFGNGLVQPAVCVFIEGAFNI